MPKGIKGFQKGHKVNLGKKRPPRSEEWIKNLRKALKGKSKGEKNPMFGMTGEKCPAWRGDNASKRSIHLWVERYKGKALEHKCIDCGKQAQGWSNVDHTYRRILKDYKPRCVSCHRLYDNKHNKK